MVWRKALATLLIVVASSPAWGAAEPLGSITSTGAATVRDTQLTEGSTVFSGDVISVAEHGTTRIAFSSGAQAEVLGNSSVRLTKANGNIQMIVDRGQASFRTSGNKGISALVADATVRPVNGAETLAVIQSLGQTHAIVAAEKGALLITTAHDAKTYTVNEGEAADLSTAPDPPQGGGRTPTGTVSALSGTMVVVTVVIVAAAAAVAAYLLWRKETAVPMTTLQNEVSPATLN